MGNFTDADKIRKQNEGGYAFAGRGIAETYQGVDRIANPNAKIWPIIDVIKKANPNITAKEMNLTLASNKEVQAYIINFYVTNYFNPLKLAQVIDQNIVNCAYDCSVNQGVGIAAKFMQMACNNVIQHIGAKISLLVVDGQVGIKTIGIVNALEAELVYNEMNSLRRNRYIDIANSNPDKRQWLKTWLQRLTPYNHSLVI